MKERPQGGKDRSQIGLCDPTGPWQPVERAFVGARGIVAGQQLQRQLVIRTEDKLARLVGRRKSLDEAKHFGRVTA